MSNNIRKALYYVYIYIIKLWIDGGHKEAFYYDCLLLLFFILRNQNKTNIRRIDRLKRRATSFYLY